MLTYIPLESRHKCRNAHINVVNITNIPIIGSLVKDNEHIWQTFAMFLTIFYHEISVKQNNLSAAAAIAKVKVAKSELTSCCQKRQLSE